MKHLNITPELHDYMLDIGVDEHPILKKLRDKTSELALAHMAIPPLQAQLLQFLIKTINAKKVLEIGTFTGYSALAMALALPKDGKLITCDRNPDWTKHGKPFWVEAKMDNIIELRLGAALETLNNLLTEGYKAEFDFIFIDFHMLV